MNNKLDYYQRQLDEISYDCMVARNNGEREKVKELWEESYRVLGEAESEGFKATPELSDLELPRYILE